MDIMLHLGAHRCATTTFQSFVWTNRVHLANHGLTCWTPRRTRDGLLHGLIRHPEKITVQDERNAIRSVGRLRVEIARLRANGQKGLLITDENILGTVRDNIAGARLYGLLRERLMRFQPAFDGEKLTIGLSVRSYEYFWTSGLIQMVERGAPLPSVDTLDFLTTQPRRWRSVVRDIAAVFPQANIVVWPFERMACQPEAQLRALGARDLGPLDVGDLWRNRGADVAGLNTLLAMRGEHIASDGFAEAGQRWMPFDEDQCSVLRAEYRRDLTWLKAGAEGLARYVDGRPMSAPNHNHCVKMLAYDIEELQDDRRSTPASVPDRDDKTRTTHSVLFGGRHDRIETGLDRAGAS